MFSRVGVQLVELCGFGRWQAQTWDWDQNAGLLRILFVRQISFDECQHSRNIFVCFVQILVEEAGARDGRADQFPWSVTHCSIAANVGQIEIPLPELPGRIWRTFSQQQLSDVAPVQRETGDARHTGQTCQGRQPVSEVDQFVI